MTGKDRKNSEGYSDPTAYAALKNINRDEDRYRKLRKVILSICDGWRASRFGVRSFLWIRKREKYGGEKAVIQGVTLSKPQWSDLTPEKIYDELKALIQKAKLMQKPYGIIVVAGETAYAMVRQIFPEDTETVKIKPCQYLEKGQCLVIEDKPFPIGRMF